MLKVANNLSENTSKDANKSKMVLFIAAVMI